MTREDDTGYSAWAPLKRARRGLPQDELSIWEIATTTFPEKDAHEERKDLTNDLIQTIKAGRLAAYGNPEGWYARVSRLNQQPLSMRIRNRDSIMNLRPIALGEQWERCNLHEGTRIIRGIWKGFRAIFDDTDFHGDNCLIRRADYLAFLDLPQRAWIPKPDWWKAPQDEPAPLPQGEPDRPEQGAAAKKAALAQLLDELDKRAVERGAGFDRHSLPGTKAEFALLLKSHCSIFRHIGIEQIDDAYLNGECQFQPGAKAKQGKGAAIWALFPEYDLK